MCIRDSYQSYSHQIWHDVTLRRCASDDMSYDDLDLWSRSKRPGSKVTLPYFSEIIEATVTKLGTKVLYNNTLQNTHITVTLTEGQGRLGQGHRSRKVTLTYFSETIEATDPKLGKKVQCASKHVSL